VTDSTSPSVTPDDIDLAFVARPAADVCESEIAGEMILVGDDRAMVLNPTGTLVWQCLDGDVSLGELAREIGDELGADPELVGIDVVEFARALGASGLLEDVELVVEEPDNEAVAPVRVGAELEPFALPGSDGVEHSLAEWRGGDVLLVHWSAHCGYCGMIAPALAELRPALEQQGVTLLFVATGDLEANRTMLIEAGIDAPLLVEAAGGPGPFVGFGTPAAYLLDADGVVARELAHGATDVLAVAEDVAGVTLTADPFAPAAPAEVGNGHVRYLPPPGGG
jgi:peroxiredoxin